MPSGLPRAAAASIAPREPFSRRSSWAHTLQRMAGIGRPLHVFEEHVGEVRLSRLEAESRVELFAEAGWALAELQIDAAGSDAPREFEDVTLRAADHASNMLRPLGE